MSIKGEAESIMRSNKKVIFNVLVVVGFLSVVLSTLYLGILICIYNPIDSFTKICTQLLNFFGQITLNHDEAFRVFIILATIVAATIGLALFSSSILHETGHLIVYGILGEKAHIKRKPKDTINMISKNLFCVWITEPETPGFNDKLKENNPFMYICLAASGVFLVTIISIVLNYITALSIKNGLLWWSWILVFYTIFFDFRVLYDYKDNMWSKGSNTDGQKIREVI